MSTRDDVLNFIIQYKKDYDGNSPTIREIVHNVEAVNSTSAANYVVHQLEEDGLIEFRYTECEYGGKVTRRRVLCVVNGAWSDLLGVYGRTKNFDFANRA